MKIDIDGIKRTDLEAVMDRLMTHGGGLTNILKAMIIVLQRCCDSTSRDNTYLKPTIAKLKETLQVYNDRYKE